MAQTWRHLLFAHWPVDSAALRPLVDASLPIDTFEGKAWIGVTPFAVHAFRLRVAPPLPLVHAFPEVNVRTYVTVDGKPGIYFFSLDAGSRFAVESARRIYRLPYFRSRAALDERQGELEWASHRVEQGDPPAELRTRYRPTGPAFEAEPGSLEHFLVERYCLYTVDERGVRRGQIHHPPWLIQPARAEIDQNTMAQPLGLDLDGQPLLHLARTQDVVFWLLEPVDA